MFSKSMEMGGVWKFLLEKGVGVKQNGGVAILY